MRVIVTDEDVEIFAFDQEADRGKEYPSDIARDLEADRIMRALTDALRFVLHIQQPE
jgi:hypothetical protein